MGFALAAQAIVQILLPAYLIWDLYRTKEFTKTGRHLLVLITALGLAFIFFIARWDITSIYLRWLLPLGFLLAALRVYRRPVTGNQKSRVAFLWIWAVLGCLLVGWVIWAKFPPGGAVDLASPLEGGPNYVAHGGNATLLNYHTAPNPKLMRWTSPSCRTSATTTYFRKISTTTRYTATPYTARAPAGSSRPSATWITSSRPRPTGITWPATTSSSTARTRMSES